MCPQTIFGVLVPLRLISSFRIMVRQFVFVVKNDKNSAKNSAFVMPVTMLGVRMCHDSARWAAGHTRVAAIL